VVDISLTDSLLEEVKPVSIIGALEMLQALWLDDNSLIGNLPSSLVELPPVMSWQKDTLHGSD
jgi:hypothetical protein